LEDAHPILTFPLPLVSFETNGTGPGGSTAAVSPVASNVMTVGVPTGGVYVITTPGDGMPGAGANVSEPQSATSPMRAAAGLDASPSISVFPAALLIESAPDAASPIRASHGIVFTMIAFRCWITERSATACQTLRSSIARIKKAFTISMLGAAG